MSSIPTFKKSLFSLEYIKDDTKLSWCDLCFKICCGSRDGFELMCPQSLVLSSVINSTYLFSVNLWPWN